VSRDFSTWLFEQRHSDDPVGHLALIAYVDVDWPRGASLSDLQEHLRELGASESTTDALSRAWLEWEANEWYPRGAP